MTRQRDPKRYEVWTDAGRTTDRLWRIARSLSNTNAYGLVRLLRGEGWKAELRVREEPLMSEGSNALE